jgi:hypothetical protein
VVLSRQNKHVLEALSVILGVPLII